MSHRRENLKKFPVFYNTDDTVQCITQSAAGPYIEPSEISYGDRYKDIFRDVAPCTSVKAY
jgi:hypothetical protein